MSVRVSQGATELHLGKVASGLILECLVGIAVQAHQFSMW